MLIIYPYKLKSKSAAALSSSLATYSNKVTRVRPDGAFKNNYPENNLIINWGNSSIPGWWKQYGRTLNHPSQVAIAANKLTTFNLLKEAAVSIPKYTESLAVAQEWIDEGNRVYGRQILTGHSGRGIRIFDSETICSPDECPLYTLDTKAKTEYRIHVVAGMVIDSQQKKKREGFEGGIRGIRNSANGWVFAREGMVVPITVLEQAIKAVRALQLDFGAVDVGYKESNNTAYVYEVNTAPGIEATTLLSYAKAFGDYYEHQ